MVETHVANKANLDLFPFQLLTPATWCVGKTTKPRAAPRPGHSLAASLCKRKCFLLANNLHQDNYFLTNFI